MPSPNYNALAASNGSGESVRATVQGTRSIGSTAVTVNATTDWPTGTFIATTGTLLSTGKLDPTTVQVFYGTASGTTITITSFAAGYSDLGNSIGDVVVLKPTTEWANIVAQGLQSTTQFPAQFANFVEPAGGVWTTSSGLVGTQTAGNVWFGGVRSAMPAVATYTFTASKDTYVDFNPATSAFTYVAVTNGAAEPAVTASNVRIAKIVTNGSVITSISQQAYQKAVPLVWQYLNSATYTAGTVTSTGSTPTLITNLSVPVTIPAGATAVRITVDTYNLYPQTGSAVCSLSIYSGASLAALTTQIGGIAANSAPTATAYNSLGHAVTVIKNPTPGTIYYSAAISAAASNARIDSGSATPATIQVEVC